jgi:hypothetical protein
VGSGHSFSSKFLEEQGHHPENGMFNLNHILEILPFFKYIYTLEKEIDWENNCS